MARTLYQFECHYNQVAQPFDWRFTSADLGQLLKRLVKDSRTYSWQPGTFELRS